MVWYSIDPSVQVLCLPLFLVFAVATSTGVSLLLSALNVKYRDFRHAVPFLAQVELYVSPVGFASTIIPDGWRLLYYLNPMVGVIDGFRWAILGNAFPLYMPGFLVSLSITGLLVFSGTVYFRKVERFFADVV